jgi:hypothetical protein
MARSFIGLQDGMSNRALKKKILRLTFSIVR